MDILINPNLISPTPPPHKKEKENEALFNVLGHTDFIGSL